VIHNRLGRNFAVQKVESTLHLLNEISSIEFPHDDATRALNELKNILEDVLTDLQAALGAPPTSGILRSQQLRAVDSVIEALDLAGLVANSANIRNAFEGHGPLLEIARKLIGPHTYLILSFQWEWMPFTYPQTSILTDCVIIGLPASEASNALVLPAVGHELGHSLWRSQDLASAFQTEIRDDIIKKITSKLFWSAFLKLYPDARKKTLGDMVNQISWKPSFNWAMRQIEEIFCDFVGLYVFGSSYLDCLAYLLSPVFSEGRTCTYPSMRQRAEFLVEATQYLGISVQPRFVDQFDLEKMQNLSDRDRLLLQIADSVVCDLSAKIRIEAFKLCNNGIGAFGNDNSGTLKESFERNIPGGEANNLRSILVAGWDTFKGETFMNSDTDTSRTSSLNELIFKTMEISELNRTP